MLTTTTYTLPAHWASYLVNGDPMAYSDQELADILDWLGHEKPGDCTAVSPEHWFAKTNDATWQAGDVATYTFENDPTPYDASHMNPTVAARAAT